MKVPDVVARAMSLSESLGFGSSCFPETGTLLATLAAASRGTLGEIGTGAGVGTAWLASGMAPSARLVTIERDARLAAAVRELFADDERIIVIEGDWRGILQYGPFAVLFVDATPAKTEGTGEITSALSPGGIALLDDLSPEDAWRSAHEGFDQTRDQWRAEPRLVTNEVTIRAGDRGIVLTARRVA